ncbi:MAG: helix-turn-helix domain-containing protein [Dehalococcoidia bacterium]|nr:helix-turn-helix domain-containing protein [Dehalococcoidia bacterium]
MLTINEAAKRINYSDRWLRQKCRIGELAAEKAPNGRKWLISEDALNEFISKNGATETQAQGSMPNVAEVNTPSSHGGDTPPALPKAVQPLEIPSALVSPVQAAVTTSKLWVEHHEEMNRLVKRWSDELTPYLGFRLRHLNDSKTLDDRGSGLHRMSLWDLDGSSYYYLLWQVNKGGTVCLTCPLEVNTDREIRIVRDYLHQHLQSSSYRWLLEGTKKGIKRWKQIGGKELKARAHLLNRIDRAVEKLSQEPVGKRNPLADPDRIKSAGLTTWFSESIWRVILDDYHDSREYNNQPFERGLFKVRYGDNCLGLAATKEDGEAYIKRHEKLMPKFARSRPVADIKRLMTERESLTSDMRDAFTKFLVDKVLPGKCDSPVCR